MAGLILKSELMSSYGHHNASGCYLVKGRIIWQWYERENEQDLLNQLSQILEEPNDYRKIFEQVETSTYSESPYW